MVKKWISLICACIISLIMLLTPLAVRAQNNSTDETIQENSSQQPETADLIQAPSGILMEAQTEVLKR